MTSLFFDWLAHGVDKKENGHLYCNNDGEAVDDFYQFHKDVTLLAFATNSVYVLVLLLSNTISIPDKTDKRLF